jgi:hypothetical protein
MCQKYYGLAIGMTADLYIKSVRPNSRPKFSAYEGTGLKGELPFSVIAKGGSVKPIKMTSPAGSRSS